MEIKNQGKSSTGIDANLTALLSYLLGFITGIIFYSLEKKNKFVRFHALQSIITFASLFILDIVLKLLPIIGCALASLLGIAGIFLWVILMFKAYQGEYFKLPLAGRIAEQNS
ncbi:MAG: DUF4870 domain-containing protein [Candidatus Omnitrophica bacterium]|nr:DUF4870 domain-containing protein [Candidatus Omnitrophota bacterium]MDD5027222.1 DUF4870 domain-containing protein [Candidatus Omnitrophota bacterium]MDD5661624.1 DUF4870 domain-containing protein [Candidatus Omnitrophota bacterium]